MKPTLHSTQIFYTQLHVTWFHHTYLFRLAKSMLNFEIEPGSTKNPSPSENRACSTQTPAQPHKPRASKFFSPAPFPSLLVLNDVIRRAGRGFPRHSRRRLGGGYRRDLPVTSFASGTIFAPASRSSSRRRGARGARGAFVGGRGECGERIRRTLSRVRCPQRR